MEGRVIDANRALCEMLGYSAHELVGMGSAEFTHPGDVERDLTHMRQMLAGEIRTYHTEKRYLHADGHDVWAILSMSLTRYTDGDRPRFIAQIQDISARKHSEERFAFLAYHDELTDLPNRSMFNITLSWRWLAPSAMIAPSRFSPSTSTASRSSTTA